MELSSGIILLGIVFVASLLVLTLFVLIWYSGLLETVSVGAGAPPYGDLVIMYKFGRGPYKNAGAVFTEVTSIAPKHKCLGIYYDDPKQVASEKLRWVVGCIISEGQEELDGALMAALESEHYKKYSLPAVNNVIRTSFPYRSQLSILVGMWRVYPELALYIKSMKLCAHPFIEVYAEEVIHYYVPLSKQECFYVPECDSEYNVVPDKKTAAASHQIKEEHTQLDRAKNTETDMVMSNVAGEGDLKAMPNQSVPEEKRLSMCSSLTSHEDKAKVDNPAEEPAVTNQGESLLSDRSTTNKSPVDDPLATKPDCDAKPVAADFNPTALKKKPKQLPCSTECSDGDGDMIASARDKKVAEEKNDSLALSNVTKDSVTTNVDLISDNESLSDIESSPLTSVTSGNQSFSGSFSSSSTGGSSRKNFPASSSSGASGEVSQDTGALSGDLQVADVSSALAELSSDSDVEVQPVMFSSKPDPGL